MAMDMSPLSKSFGRPLEGILGLDVLVNYVVRIDPQNRVV